MPRFKITSVSLIDDETPMDAMNLWREFPFDYVTEVTMVELGRLDTPELPKTMAQKMVGTATALVKEAAAQVGVTEKTRFCSVHQVAMQKKPSKFGKDKFYFSCPEKNDDGSYCKAKPQ